MDNINAVYVKKNRLFEELVETNLCGEVLTVLKIEQQKNPKRLINTGVYLEGGKYKYFIKPFKIYRELEGSAFDEDAAENIIFSMVPKEVQQAIINTITCVNQEIHLNN